MCPRWPGSKGLHLCCRASPWNREGLPRGRHCQQHTLPESAIFSTGTGASESSLRRPPRVAKAFAEAIREDRAVSYYSHNLLDTLSAHTNAKYAHNGERADLGQILQLRFDLAEAHVLASSEPDGSVPEGQCAVLA